MASIFSVFNSGLLVVASLIVSYVAVMGVTNTANEGEAMGRNWSSLWTPVRIVSGGSVLLPTTSGYLTPLVWLVYRYLVRPNHENR